MRKIRLDGRKMDSRTQAHSYLQRMLTLPEYYGANLDALADCLSEVSGVVIIMAYSEAMKNSLGEYGVRLLEVLKAAGAGRTDFFFRQTSK